MKTFILIIPSHGLNQEAISNNLSLCYAAILKCGINLNKARILPYFIPHTVLSYVDKIDDRVALRTQMKLLTTLIDLLASNNNEVFLAPGYQYTVIGSLAVKLCSEYMIDRVELALDDTYIEPMREFTPAK